MREADLLEEVRKLAQLYHWQMYHTWNSLHSTKGFPDCFLIREREDGTVQCMAVELKSESGQVTPEQAEWLRLLRLAGIPSYVWRPADIEQIATVLRGD